MFIGTLDQSLLAYCQQARLGRQIGPDAQIEDQDHLIRWLFYEPGVIPTRIESWGKMITHDQMPPDYVLEAIDVLLFAFQADFFVDELFRYRQQLTEQLERAKKVWTEDQKIRTRIAAVLIAYEMKQNRVSKR